LSVQILQYELGWRQAVELGMGSVLVVVAAPLLKRSAGMEGRWERVLVEEFIA